jgi:hypothetical protein
MIDFKSIVKRTKKLLSTLFQASRVDQETESLSKNPKFLSIIEQARAQKGKGGMSSEEMRRWVETELSED